METESHSVFSGRNRTLIFRTVLILPLCALSGSLLLPSTANAIWASYPIVEECQWSTAVHLVSIGNSQHCTGTYLGNGMVVTAGHCLWDASPHDVQSELPGAWVLFGETTATQDQSVVRVAADCVIRPDFEVFDCGLFDDLLCGTGPDLAYCMLHELPEPLVDGFGVSPSVTGSIVNPMVPTGCERDWLYNRLYVLNDEVLPDAIGMGSIDTTPSSAEMGMKRHVEGRLVRQVPLGQDQVIDSLGMSALEMYQPMPWDITDHLVASPLLGEGPIRGGDSGGPLMIAMPDGSHRLIGVAAASKGRNNYDFLMKWSHFVYYTPLPVYLRWIEIDSGVDITPCHDWVDGQWQFIKDCSAYYGDATPEGTWMSGCYDLDARVEPTFCGGLPGGVPPDSVVLPANFGKSAGADLDWQIYDVLQAEQGLAGAEVLFASPGVDELLGGGTADVLRGTRLDDVVRSGAGDDFVHGSAGADVIVSGMGDDVVFGDEGVDRIHPGSGTDFVDAGAGDDYVVVYDPCELEAGEALVGGPGHDVLISPLAPEAMALMGVYVDEFEDFVITGSLEGAAWCSRPREAPTWSSAALHSGSEIEVR